MRNIPATIYAKGMEASDLSMEVNKSILLQNCTSKYRMYHHDALAITMHEALINNLIQSPIALIWSCP